LKIESDLLAPAIVHGRIADPAVLVDFPEAAVGDGAGGQPVVSAVHPQLGLRVRVVEGVDDGHSLAGSGARRRAGQLVRRSEVRRSVSADRSKVQGRPGPPVRVRAPVRVAASHVRWTRETDGYDGRQG